MIGNLEISKTDLLKYALHDLMDLESSVVDLLVMFFAILLSLIFILRGQNVLFPET